jgi:hypothetical protein
MPTFKVQITAIVEADTFPEAVYLVFKAASGFRQPPGAPEIPVTVADISDLAAMALRHRCQNDEC